MPMTAYVVSSPLISARCFVGEASLVGTEMKNGRALKMAPLRHDCTLTSVFLQLVYLEASTGARYSSRRSVRTA